MVRLIATPTVPPRPGPGRGPGRCLRWAALTCLAAALVAGGCRSAGPGGVSDRGDLGRPVERGIASWYGPGFQGNPTASGERFDTRQLTAAHRTLPFGTIVKVVNRDNGRSVTVRINDRGPFIRGRVIDLSRAAAERIDMVRAGIAEVDLYIVPPAGAAVPAAAAEAPFPYAVQAGAFRQLERARDLAASLAGDFGEVAVVAVDGWYRVRVGRYASRREARAVARELESRGVEAAILHRP